MKMSDILQIVASSSKGNCYIYNKDLMVDVGVPYSKIKDYLKDIKVICLTHAHSDHFNKTTIKKIAYEYPNIKYMAGRFLSFDLMECGVPLENIGVLHEDIWYDIGEYEISPVVAIHDVPNFGYKIIIKENNYAIFHITDTSSLDDIEAKDYNWYSIEGNYTTDEELREKIIEEKKEGKFSYLERVKDTHLSQVQALNWLQKNMGENSKYMFIHKHIDKEVKDGKNI